MKWYQRWCDGCYRPLVCSFCFLVPPRWAEATAFLVSSSEMPLSLLTTSRIISAAPLVQSWSFDFCADKDAGISANPNTIAITILLLISLIILRQPWTGRLGSGSDHHREASSHTIPPTQARQRVGDSCLWVSKLPRDRQTVALCLSRRMVHTGRADLEDSRYAAIHLPHAAPIAFSHDGNRSRLNIEYNFIFAKFNGVDSFAGPSQRW